MADASIRQFAIQMIKIMDSTICNMCTARDEGADEEVLDYMAETVREINGQLAIHWSAIDGLDNLEDYLLEHMSEGTSEWFEEEFGF